MSDPALPLPPPSESPHDAPQTTSTNFQLLRAFRYLSQHGNGKRGQQEREEARGFLQRAVEVRDGKWLCKNQCNAIMGTNTKLVQLKSIACFACAPFLALGFLLPRTVDDV